MNAPVPGPAEPPVTSRLRQAFRDLSIRRKLVLMITCSSGLALVLACAGFVLHDVVTFRAALRENMSTLAAIVGKNTAAAMTFNDPAAATEVLSALAGEPRILAATLYRDNQPFARYARRGASVAEPPMIAGGSFARFSRGRLELSRPVGSGTSPRGTLYLVAELDVIDERLHGYITIAAALLAAAMVAAGLLSARFQRAISKPVSDLVDLTRRVTTDRDYSVRVRRHRRDELGTLFDGFNAMLEQIQQRDVALQSAHEDLERRVEQRTRQLQQQVAERVAAEKALQQQLTRINLLNQIASALSDRHDLDCIVRVVLAQLEAHLPVDFGSVSIFETARGLLQVAAVRRRGQPEEKVHRLLAPSGPVDEALAAFDCRAGQQVYVPDASRGAHERLRHFATDDLRSVVAVPLIVERRFFGVLVVARVAPGAFTSGECEFLRMLGEQVAVAGSQAHLYSELQRAYTELRQSQRAVMQQERLRALGQMASGIAHDINNTLTPVVTFSDLLLEIEPGLSEHARTCLKYIQTAGTDIAGIVARLRDFYRPRDAAEAIEAIDLEELVNQVIELTRPRWRDMPQARGVVIELRTEFAPGLPRVAGQATELREAVTNLMLNAVDALPQGGVLTLRTRVRADQSTHTQKVLVEVADNGVGMDENTRQRCLEPFFSTKGQRGTGLGLAMVYGVMERHAGSIEIESQLGAGTTMRLVFPVLNPTDGGGLDLLGEHEAKLPPLRVLCVDDEPMLRHVLLDLFRADGHDASVAEGGEGGLKLFRQAAVAGRPYDVVVTDLGMPHMDGRQFAEILKRESPSTPVILLTGWGRIMQEQGDRPMDVDVILSKPPRTTEVRRALRRLVALKEG